MNGSNSVTGASSPSRQASLRTWLKAVVRSSCDSATRPPRTPPKKSPLRRPPILARAVTASAAVGASSAGVPVSRSISGRDRGAVLKEAQGEGRGHPHRRIGIGQEPDHDRRRAMVADPARGERPDPAHERVGRHQGAPEKIGLELTGVFGREHRGQLLDDRLLLRGECRRYRRKQQQTTEAQRPQRRSGGNRGTESVVFHLFSFTLCPLCLCGESRPYRTRAERDREQR